MRTDSTSTLSVTVGAEDSGLRLDHFLAQKFTYHSRTVWQKEIGAERILLSGRKAKPGSVLKEGETVVYLPRFPEEPPVRTDYGILFEDEFLIAVDKPGDLPVHPAGVYRKGNLLTLLAESGNRPNLFPIHRLDRETSGVVLFAKDQNTASSIAALFSSGNIQKYYITKVYGSFPKRVRAFGILTPDPDSKIRKKRKFSVSETSGYGFRFRNKSGSFFPKQNDFFPKGEICLTYFRKIESISVSSDPRVKTYDPDENLGSYVLCKPATGRMHQIRATLYGLGFPLFGDKLYGKDEEVFLEFIEGKNPDLTLRLGMQRQALHAYALRFVHPVTKKRMKIRAPLPEDFYERS
ncbi:RluA family pseudouridine synthase [Leptospira gomenensis]|uniref:RluA family pseudouridine synthase n=1 Tax=Leptospira gomenensis TaxID=2484974 RepID=A0A5F1YGI8_9LEPT|nr:RluA family pseudouridine synthase [Leptospira gomenensis]TGK31528.1 RluA family pseudouridine synthase [Leptospira gomenensis]TGK44178.1 RluA family pseudouridine synthase [Leptospira gomenensis]TGK46233.1 RluA family pseudouridine synthase [Leptospira gomenensis]TGK54758.1 RluA family pseudouridine synthase [Leptospira gomenensis]